MVTTAACAMSKTAVMPDTKIRAIPVSIDARSMLAISSPCDVGGLDARQSVSVVCSVAAVKHRTTFDRAKNSRSHPRELQQTFVTDGARGIPCAHLKKHMSLDSATTITRRRASARGRRRTQLTAFFGRLVSKVLMLRQESAVPFETVRAGTIPKNFSAPRCRAIHGRADSQVPEQRRG
jgi:hypothetical protein